MELSIPYTLTGPDGTVIVFGNTRTISADPNFIGYLDAENGIAGLDGPDVREVAAELVQGDGGINYTFFRGRRPITINGVIAASKAEGALLNAAIEKIKGAADALKADATLSWTNTGEPARRLLLRSPQPPRISGRRPKSFLLQLVSQDWRITAVTLSTLAAQTFNSSKTATNAGDAPAFPKFTIRATTAAGTALRIRNTTLALEVRFKTTFALTAGQTLVVDFNPPYPSVKVNGVDNYDKIDYLNTTWWTLRPGANSIQVDAGSPSNTWDVEWRDAWR